MKVVKFGGSSLASATQFKKVHDIVLEDTDRHYVVPSAPGKRNKEDTKVTDLLILAYSHHNKDDFEEIYDRIKARYNGIITELGLDISLEEDFKEIKEEIKKHLLVNWKHDYYCYSREWPYKGLKHRILAESLIADPKELKEYKFFCFNGIPKFYQSCWNRSNF